LILLSHGTHGPSHIPGLSSNSDAMADDPKKEEVCDFVCHQQEQAAVADGRVRLLPPCTSRGHFCSLDVLAATTVLTVNAMLSEIPREMRPRWRGKWARKGTYKGHDLQDRLKDIWGRRTAIHSAAAASWTIAEAHVKRSESDRTLDGKCDKYFR